MSEDARLRALLRSAIPPIGTTAPARDMWPRVVARSRDHHGWSWFDLAIAGGVAMALLMRPELLVLLAYHF